MHKKINHLKDYILIYNNASSHLNENINKFKTQNSIETVNIPSGLILFLKPLDISINKPIKYYLKQEYTNRRINAMSNKNNPFYLNKISITKEELISIIEEICIMMKKSKKILYYFFKKILI